MKKNMILLGTPLLFNLKLSFGMQEETGYDSLNALLDSTEITSYKMDKK